jgi:hypoxanthine-DNA glycosylase
MISRATEGKKKICALPPLVDHNSKILILGSMPGNQSIALQQYYANRGNAFWKLMFAVFDQDFSEDYSERKKLISANRIALWEVLASCQRNGSADSAIKNESPNNINAFLKLWPQITHIFFDSVGARKFYFKYNQPNPAIAYYTLPSSSGLYANKTFMQKLEEWRALRLAK